MFSFSNRGRSGAAARAALGGLLLLTAAGLAATAARAEPLSLDAATGIVRGAQQVAALPGGQVVAVTNGDGTDADLGLIRLNADGTVDGTFAPGALHLSSVASITALPGGQILVAGEVDSPDGTSTVSQMLRLNADGTVDAAFAPGASYADQPILLPQGKLLLLEETYADDGTAATALVRLNADGSVDGGFAAGVVFDPSRSYAVQPLADGKLLLNSDGGDNSPPTLVRLAADGSVDPSFTVLPVAGGSFTSVLPLPDGRVAAAFSSTDGSVNTVLRFAADGSVDLSFHSPDSFDGPVNTLYPLPGGGLLAAGDFGSVDSAVRNGVARFSPDGGLDTAYDPIGVAGGYVAALLPGPADDLFAALGNVTPPVDSSAIVVGPTGGAGSFGGASLLVDHFAADGTLLGSVTVSGSAGCSLAARADGSGVYIVADNAVLIGLAPGVLLGTAGTASPAAGNDGFAPPPPPSVTIVRGRPSVTVTAVQSKVYAGSPVPGKFLLRRTGNDVSTPLRVVYNIGGTAVAGRDYRSLRRTRVIPAGRQTAQIVVRPVGERFASVDGGLAKVTVTLLRRAGYRMGAHRAARVKILDPGVRANGQG